MDTSVLDSGTSDARDAIVDQLARDDFTIISAVLLGTPAMVARRARRTGYGRIHVFVVVLVTDDLSGDQAERLADTAQRYAIAHKGGLPRGLQAGTSTVIVFLDDRPQDSAVCWVDRSPIHRYAAMRFAVLIDTTRRELVYWEGRWPRGWFHRATTLDLVRTGIVRPVNAGSDQTALRLRRARAATRTSWPMPNVRPERRHARPR